MESLAHLVTESLVRHGFETTFDHRRLQWSQWFRCQDGFSFLLAPCKPGLFALGEEVMAPGELAGLRGPSERSEEGLTDGKRMLALFQVSEADDLGMALGRLFLPGNPGRERLSSGRCFARYVVIEEPAQRRSACVALQRWMASSAEAVSGVPQTVSGDAHVAPDVPVRGAEQSSAEFVSGHDLSRATNPAISTSALAAPSADLADASETLESSNKQAQIGPPTPIPSGF